MVDETDGAVVRMRPARGDNVHKKSHYSLLNEVDTDHP